MGCGEEKADFQLVYDRISADRNSYPHFLLFTGNCLSSHARLLPSVFRLSSRILSYSSSNVSSGV